MNTFGPGLEILPLLGLLVALIPVLAHDLMGKNSPFTESPLATYSRWWARITHRRKP